MLKSITTNSVRIRVLSTIILLMAIAFPEAARSQNVQAWFDYYVNKSFGKTWNYEGNVELETLLRENGWVEYSVSNSVAAGITKWYGLGAGVQIDKTSNPVSYDITELSLTLVQDFVFVQYIPLIHLRHPHLSVCLEQRFLYYPEADTSDSKARLRLKLGGSFLLNKDKMVPDVFFIPFYFEGYFNLNGEAIEHRATKAKASLGLGYFFNERWLGEFVYKVQLARNTITDDVTRSDIILQLLIRYYL